MLDLNDMRMFVVAVECGGMAPAARRMGIQTSTLSRHIAALEASLDTELLDRGPRHFRLAEHGRQFHDRFAAIIAAAEAAERQVRALSGKATAVEPPPHDREHALPRIDLAPTEESGKAIRRQDIVQAYIMRGIRSKALACGDKLPPERDLAATLGVARQAVREAIRSLEMSGVLRLERGARGGAFIREIGSDGITYSIRNLLILGDLPLSDVLEIRASILGQACRQAAERGDERDFDLMDDNIRTLVHINRTLGQAASIPISTGFYRIAARASRNHLLTAFVDAISDIVEEMLQEMQTWPLMEEGEQTRRDALQAIRAGDGARAEAIIRAHCVETNLVLLERGGSAYTL